MSEELDNIQHGEIRPVDINHEMQRSYLDYAMSVIVSRALPDVRDGLKPVHRRVLYAMYDGGYRPDKAFSKCARVVGDVMGTYHPHGDSAIYDTLVRLAQPWSLRYPLVQGQGNFGSPGNDPAAAMRYTESRMAQLAMEMVRDIDEDTVDFTPNYDGRTQEPRVLPSRFPNLLANGASGIAVGMATNIPPHNLREISEGVNWALENPTASREELLEALIERIKGPDFPTGALIVGRSGIESAYRTGRGSITMRAVVEVEEEAKGHRKQLVVTQLPYQVNPDNLAEKIADLVNNGKITGISELRDESSGRTGMRLCIVLSKNAVPKVVLNNLYKHTQLQDTFGANMLALVDGVPKTLTLDLFVSNWILHQIEVIQRRTRYRLRKAQERAHILLGLLKAIDRIDEVIALIRKSPSASDASVGLMKLLDIDDLQARAILDMQLRKLAALERQELQDEYDKLMGLIAEYESILASDERQRQIVKEELAEIINKHGDERRSKFVADEGEMRDEDFIAQRDVVVTITSGGYVKRTDASNYRAQKRGGRGVKGASLRQDDVVSHFFITTTHHWILFFTNKGRVYRAKAHELPEAGRDAKGLHVANLLEFQEDEVVTQVLYLKDYGASPFLVLATKQGVVKKTALSQYDSRLSRGLIAINLKEDDELISAQLVGDDDDLILVTKDGYSVRFKADNATLRPMGRATAGVIGIRFKRETDSLLSMDVIRDDSYLVTATDGGFAKRTKLEEWNSKGRGTQGVRAMKLVEDRGSLVGAMVVDESDEVFAIASNGVVIRTKVTDVRATGRDTQGVRLMNLGEGDTLISIARAPEREDDVEDAEDTDVVDVVEGETSSDVAPETNTEG